MFVLVFTAMGDWAGPQLSTDSAAQTVVAGVAAGSIANIPGHRSRVRPVTYV